MTNEIESFFTDVVELVTGNQATFVDILRELLAFAPEIFALFKSCSPAQIKQEAQDQRGLRFMFGRAKLNFVLRRNLGRKVWRDFGHDLGAAIITIAANSSEERLATLLQSE